MTEKTLTTDEKIEKVLDLVEGTARALSTLDKRLQRIEDLDVKHDENGPGVSVEELAGEVLAEATITLKRTENGILLDAQCDDEKLEGLVDYAGRKLSGMLQDMGGQKYEI